jgi:hypothetical protein
MRSIRGCLKKLSRSDTVTPLLERAIASAGGSGPLQTGSVLAAVFDIYSTGKWAAVWSSVWPSYAGPADALLAAAIDTRSTASGRSWQGIPLSQDLLVSLLLLARMAGSYKMDPIPPGAVVLALALDPGTGAARYLVELSGSTHAELVDRIQSDLVGGKLEGFEDIAALAGAELGRRHRSARWAGALFCWWVAWLAVSAAVGWVMGALFTIAAAVCALMFTWRQPITGGWGRSRPGRRFWRMPNFAEPWFLVALLIVVILGAQAIINRNVVPVLFVPNLVIIGCIIAIMIIVSGLTFASRTPRTPARPFTPNFGYRTVFGAAAVLAISSALFAWYGRIAILERPPVPFGARLNWHGHTLAWIQNSFTEAHFGASFAHAYWPVLVAATGAVGGYVCGLAAQALLASWKGFEAYLMAISCAGGAVIIGLRYFPLPPKPALYVSTMFTPDALYKYPSGPSSIGINNHDSIAGLLWTADKQGGVTATGTLYYDDCSPNCAQARYARYPVRIVAEDPRKCNVPIYSPGIATPLIINVVIYRTIDIIALKSNVPPAETGYYVLPVPCG